jgi:REP element-mobilizing transposase RayT
MSTDAGRLHRRSIRLKGFDYTHAGAYFITMITQDRHCLFGEVVDGEMRLSPLGNVARQQWERLPSRFPHIGLAEFVLMPNHVHGIIVIYDDDPDSMDLSDTRRGTAGGFTPPVVRTNRRAPTDSPILEQFGKPVPGSIPTIIRSYKSAVAYRLNLIRRTPGAAVWQRNYYEHIIRDEAEYHRIARYILENPAGWATDTENRLQENYHA